MADSESAPSSPALAPLSSLALRFRKLLLGLLGRRLERLLQDLVRWIRGLGFEEVRLL
ncbi:hypothetical protein Scep_012917 [Stephania cephalantha]|uniref:Uncharacterized protein n=1 Tax=Stephania cephalantha TaxID=152367 RepID=A0AAP0P818_9MAGN